MKLSAAVQKSLNDQIRKEFNAAYLYLAMAAWFEERNLTGFARWMQAQVREEQSHAMRIYQWILDRGGKIQLMALDQPKPSWKSPLEVFQAAAAHEAKVSASIQDLYALAGKEKDAPTQVMLQWFLTEQVEEEAASTAIVERLRMAGDSPSGLLMLDRQLGERGGE